MIRIYRVRGESMTPTLANGDLLNVSRGPTAVARGALVVLSGPRDPDRTTIKRVVGLPGEQVRLADGVVLVDGKELDEPYLGGLPGSPGLAQGEWKLGDGECFVMGDNRAHSTDSRDYGPVKLSSATGRAWFRVWPFGRWGRVG